MGAPGRPGHIRRSRTLAEPDVGREVEAIAGPSRSRAGKVPVGAVGLERMAEVRAQEEPVRPRRAWGTRGRESGAPPAPDARRAGGGPWKTWPRVTLPSQQTTPASRR